MVKQGQYAKASKLVHQRDNFKSKKQSQSRVIDSEQAADFLLVRYALTTKHSLPKEFRETNQRFLQELTPGILANGEVGQALQSVIVNASSRVPWQFWAQVSLTWPVMAKFLKREVPAIPLAKRVYLKHLPNLSELNHLLALQFAHQAATLTLLKGQQSHQSQQLAQQLVTQLEQDGQLKWATIQALFAPFTFPINQAPDEATLSWLRQLVTFDPVSYRLPK
ncbi:hypothetical protein [Lactobacillus sp. 3B(2020)]|uniref:hypothetical protein n=1 Tax=Lactobacillus sp. 3B(2020) TaxID=2695882 RepID=UPI0015DE801C|nr:hypothetical protein [Lactobacillus sp. 3B(2020)]QLL69395.1 hypothetical protein GTO83_01980 [Lactobacillus sp. 3B(2020)]